jgi:hypothetical protein
MCRKTSSEDPVPIYRFFLVLGFILFAAVVRILPHLWNFAPVGAMALFSGAKLGRSSESVPAASCRVVLRRFICGSLHS